MKIVLAIDGSEYSKVAVSQLGALPLPIETEVCIISVYEHTIIVGPAPIPMGGFPSDYYEEMISKNKKSAEEIVGNAGGWIYKGHVRVFKTCRVNRILGLYRSGIKRNFRKGRILWCRLNCGRFSRSWSVFKLFIRFRFTIFSNPRQLFSNDCERKRGEVMYS